MTRDNVAEREEPGGSEVGELGESWEERVPYWVWGFEIEINVLGEIEAPCEKPN